MRPGRRGASKSLGASLCCLGGFGSSPCLLRRLHVPDPQSVIFWTFLSRARPSLRHAPRLILLQSILQRRFRSAAGAAIPLSSLSLSLSLCFVSRHRGSVSVPSRSVRLSDRPFPSRNPAFRCQLRVPSGRLHHESNREWKAFLMALTRLLVMIGSLPHRSHTHRQLSVPFTLQQTVYLPYLLLWPEQPI